MANFDTWVDFLGQGITPLTPAEQAALPIEDQECSICYDAYTSSPPETDAVRIDICNHVFGRDCLAQHVQANQENSSSCPMCRTRLFGGDGDHDSDNDADSDSDSDDEYRVIAFEDIDEDRVLAGDAEAFFVMMDYYNHAVREQQNDIDFLSDCDRHIANIATELQNSENVRAYLVITASAYVRMKARVVFNIRGRQQRLRRCRELFRMVAERAGLTAQFQQALQEVRNGVMDFGAAWELHMMDG